jgi:hypothetical protein
VELVKVEQMTGVGIRRKRKMRTVGAFCWFVVVLALSIIASSTYCNTRVEWVSTVGQQSVSAQEFPIGSAIEIDSQQNVYTLVDTIDSVVYTDSSNTRTTIGTPTTTNSVVLVKQNTNGVTLWTSSINAVYGVSNLKGVGLVVDKSDNVYLVGNVYSNVVNNASLVLQGSMKVKCMSQSCVFWAKFTSDGVCNFVRVLESEPAGGSVTAFDIATNREDSISIVGNYNGTFNTRSSKDLDLWIGVFDMSGVNKWFVTEGDQQEQTIQSVTYDKRGNIYVAGKYNYGFSFGGTQLTTGPLYNIFFAKVNGTTGTIQYALYTGAEVLQDSRISVTVDHDNNPVILSSFNSTFTGPGSTVTVTDGLLLAKYNEVSTQFSYAKAIDGSVTGIVQGAKVLVDNQGHAIIAGSYYNGATFSDVGPSRSLPGYHTFIATFDPANNTMDVRFPSLNRNDASKEYPTGAAISMDNNIYVVGVFGSVYLSLGSYPLKSSGNFNTFTFKLTSQSDMTEYNSEVWLRRAGGYQYNTVSQIYVDKNENVYVTGSFDARELGIEGTDSNVIDPIMIKGFDQSHLSTYLMKYNKFGQVLWSQYGVSDMSNAVSTIVTNSSIFVAGTYSSNVTFGTNLLLPTKGAQNDIFIVRYDPVGNATWAVAFGGSGEDTVRKMKLDNQGYLLLVGQCQDLGIPGQPLFGSADGYLMVLNPNNQSIHRFLAFGGLADDEVVDIAIDNSGNIVLALSANGPGNIGILGQQFPLPGK